MENISEYSGIDNLEVMREAINYNNYLISLIFKECNNNTQKILDFGAGIGTFTLAVKKKFEAIQALELDRKLFLQLKSNGITTYQTSQQIQNASFDLIYSFNVLEHIEDDAAIISELYRLLKPGGKLILYVPAFNILYSSMDKKVGHLRRYRRNQLISLCETQKFRIHKAQYIDSLGFLMTFLYRFLGNQHGQLNIKLIKIFDRYIFPLSLFCDRILYNSLGKNLLVIANKI